MLGFANWASSVSNTQICIGETPWMERRRGYCRAKRKLPDVLEGLVLGMGNTLSRRKGEQT